QRHGEEHSKLGASAAQGGPSNRPHVSVSLRQIPLIAIAGAAFCAALFLTSSIPHALGQQEQDSRSYLPLSVGSRWELRARSTREPMVLEVTERDGDTYVVRWVNPWVRATFRFRLDGSRVVLAGLDMGQGNAPMPANTVYWDFAKRKGEQWK